MPLVNGELDSRIAIVTPENIAFHYRLAGPFRRFVAYLIDVFLRLLLVGATVFAFLFSGILLTGTARGILLVGWFVLSWFYGGLFETFWNGQTPGKWLLGLRVLTLAGQPINALQAILRNILRAVDAMPVVPLPWLDNMMDVLPLYTLGLVTMSVTDRYQRWGDLACGTMVVVEDRQSLRGIVPLDDEAIRELAAALPVNYTASPSLARAVGAYVERRRYFGVGRRAEIARIVGEPLCQRFGLPAATNYDLLLCALYYRTFVAEPGIAGGSQPAGRAGSGGSSINGGGAAIPGGGTAGGGTADAEQAVAVAEAPEFPDFTGRQP